MTNKKTLLIIDVQQYFINQFTKDVPIKILNYINKNNLNLITSCFLNLLIPNHRTG